MSVDEVVVWHDVPLRAGELSPEASHYLWLLNAIASSLLLLPDAIRRVPSRICLQTDQLLYEPRAVPEK